MQALYSMSPLCPLVGKSSFHCMLIVLICVTTVTDLFGSKSLVVLMRARHLSEIPLGYFCFGPLGSSCSLMNRKGLLTEIDVISV